ncbi:alpha/beta hydrolase [Microbacterium sp. NPDC055903]
MTSTAQPRTIWTPPARVRGTLAVVTGRGELAPVYERFGRRLSADGYLVAVFESGADAAAGWLAEAADAPRVLIGSDAGAAGVLRVLAEGATAEGAVVAGTLVDPSAAQPSDTQRTACPLHLGVLGTPEARTATSVVEALPAASALEGIRVPVLAVHGGADEVSPFGAAAEALSSIADLELVETVDGLHDALNDQQHRSVAAALVQWLERLRTGDVRAAILRRADVTSEVRA